MSKIKVNFIFLKCSYFFFFPSAIVPLNILWSSTYISVLLPITLFIYLYLWSSTYITVCLPISLLVHLYICVSVNVQLHNKRLQESLSTSIMLTKCSNGTSQREAVINLFQISLSLSLSLCLFHSVTSTVQLKLAKLNKISKQKPNLKKQKNTNLKFQWCDFGIKGTLQKHFCCKQVHRNSFI